VLFGGAIFGIFSGFYYWWPKMFGKMLNERLGSWNFWLMVIGMNMTFGPMHILGLQGQPRRMYQWTEARAGEGFFNLGFWNLISSIGSLILTVGVGLFLINIVVTARSKVRAPLDPWNARSLEWMTSNPPKEHNFDSIPHVHHLDEFFHRKYEEDSTTHTMREVATAEEVLAELERNADKHIHMPSPSYWPLVLAAGLPVVALGIIYSIPVAIVGGLIMLYALYGWALEPSTAPDSDFDAPSNNGHAVGASHG
jgi:cytochrome c oxidase subunit 1